jgi:hypothetical protein
MLYLPFKDTTENIKHKRSRYDDDDDDPDYDDEDDTYSDSYSDSYKDYHRTTRNNKKPQYYGEEKEYYSKLPKKEKDIIDAAEKSIDLGNSHMVPLRFKILQSAMDQKQKSYAIEKLHTLYKTCPTSGEYSKLYNYIESLCKIPIGRYQNLPCNKDSDIHTISTFLTSTRDRLNSSVFGHDECKDQIIRLLAQWISNPKSTGLVIGIEGPMGVGKCHAKDTPIIMYDGSIKMVQDIAVGDILMGDDSTPRHVLTLGRGTSDMYKVIDMDNNESYTVNADHILCLCDTSLDTYFEISVKEYLALPLDEQKKYRGYRPQCIYFDEGRDIPDAYDLAYNMSPTHDILTSSRKSRQEYLAGIIDYAAFQVDNHYIMYFENNVYNRQLCDHIKFLARSLGIGAYTKLETKEEYEERLATHHRFLESGIEVGRTIHKNQMKLFIYGERNKKLISSTHAPYYNISIESVGPGEYFGFTLDGNHRYIMGDFTVTHNTTLVKEGICKALGLPFGFVPLGGVSDGSYLVGHSYTYEGSRWGRIIEILMECGCMNPILFFDELDKVSNTRYGEEIKNILIHLTDFAQNANFNDKYFSDIQLDLSRCLMIFSYNDSEAVSPILRDRMVTIKASGYNTNDKVHIVEQHMLRELFDKYSFKDGDIVFSKEVIQYIITKTEEEQGVRNLKRSLESIISQINLARLIKKDIKLKDGVIQLPYKVSKKDVDTLIIKNKFDDNVSRSMMYI